MASTIASGAISIIPPNNPINATATTAALAGGGTLIYTVPTGKTLYVTGASVVMVSAGNLFSELRVEGTAVLKLNSTQDINYSLSGQPLFIANSEDEIRHYIAAGSSNIYVNIWGFLL